MYSAPGQSKEWRVDALDDVWVWSRLDNEGVGEDLGGGAGGPKIEDIDPGSEDNELENEEVV